MREREQRTTPRLTGAPPSEAVLNRMPLGHGTNTAEVVALGDAGEESTVV